MDNIMMWRCLQLAALGLGQVQPNPMVGAVIVNNGMVIGEGWHRKYGEPHAEVNAIAQVKEKALLKSATLYVSLEPCSHYGKTPPCSQLIIDHQIPKVVIATVDPNPKVAGNGIKQLQAAGVEVTCGVLEKESRYLNRRFFTYHEKKRPYIILKFAQTKNGFMDIDREIPNAAHTYWITNNALKVFSHQLRNEEQAIAVGYNTWQNDAPLLTNRLFGTHQPERFIITHPQKLANIPNGYSQISSHLPDFLERLYQQKIQSIVVEGGKATLNSFLSAGIFDELIVYEGDQTWENGIMAPQLPELPRTVITIENNTLYHYFHECR